MQGKLLEDREASRALRYFIGVSKFQMLVWGDAQTAKEHIHYKEFLKIMVRLSIVFIKSINVTGNKITSGRPFVQEANNITKVNQDTSSRHIDRCKIRNFLINKTRHNGEITGFHHLALKLKRTSNDSIRNWPQLKSTCPCPSTQPNS